MNKARDLFPQVTSSQDWPLYLARRELVGLVLVWLKAKKEAGKKAHWKLDAQSLPGDRLSSVRLQAAIVPVRRCREGGWEGRVVTHRAGQRLLAGLHGSPVAVAFRPPRPPPLELSTPLPTG